VLCKCDIFFSETRCNYSFIIICDDMCSRHARPHDQESDKNATARSACFSGS